MGPLRKLILKQKFLTSVCLGSEDPFRHDESHWILSKMFICKILQPSSWVAGWKLLDVPACESRLQELSPLHFWSICVRALPQVLGRHPSSCSLMRAKIRKQPQRLGKDKLKIECPNAGGKGRDEVVCTSGPTEVILESRLA